MDNEEIKKKQKLELTDEINIVSDYIMRTFGEKEVDKMLNEARASEQAKLKPLIKALSDYIESETSSATSGESLEEIHKLFLKLVEEYKRYKELK